MPYVRYTRACLEAAARWPPAGRPWSGALRPRVRSIPVFEPRIVDRFLARAHPITPALWFGPFIFVAAYRAVVSGEVLLSLALFSSGWLVWSLLEYFLHRFVFHFEARTPEERLRGFLAHGYHHEFPDDATRLVAPPLMSWPIGLVSGLILHAILARAAGSPRSPAWPRDTSPTTGSTTTRTTFAPSEGSASGCAATTCCTTSTIAGRVSG